MLFRSSFAMDEYQGYLRVATTTGYLPDPETSNHLFVFGLAPEQGWGLVSSLRGLAPTEDIRSVRFYGDRGFMVTFKKTDPLFAFDLSNPFEPKVEGELKIPGFSTYMHYLDENHLLAIGFDADDVGVDALGHIVENELLLAALARRLQALPSVERLSNVRLTG